MLSTKKQIVLILIILMLLGLAYIGKPSEGPIFPCPFNKLTGLYCPGCGMTRATHSLMHFDFYQAIRYNLLVAIIPPLLGVYLFIEYKVKSVHAKKVVWIMLAIAISYGIARNISVFDFLQPTTILFPL